MKRKGSRARSGPSTSGGGCCRVDSLISLDERGQMVLPKEIRERAKLGGGDKLAVIPWERDGQVLCICLVKAEGFSEMVKSLLGPMMQDLLAAAGKKN